VRSSIGEPLGEHCRRHGEQEPSGRSCGAQPVPIAVTERAARDHARWTGRDRREDALDPFVALRIRERDTAGHLLACLGRVNEIGVEELEAETRGKRHTDRCLAGPGYTDHHDRHAGPIVVVAYAFLALRGALQRYSR